MKKKIKSFALGVCMVVLLGIGANAEDETFHKPVFNVTNAEQTYSITYELYGGTNSPANPTKYTSKSGKITYAVPTREGYRFKGWFADPEFSVRVYTIAAGSTGNRTIYAKWEPIQYTIQYVLNGGTNSLANPKTYTVESDKITYAIPTAMKGYTFAGWFTEASFVNRAYTIAAGSTGNRTIYAKWVPTRYSITYELDGGTNHAKNPGSYTINTIPVVLETPKKQYYIFDGWYTDCEMTKRIEAVKNLPGDLTIYAKWSPQIYHITYDLRGGEAIAPNPTEYSYGIRTNLNVARRPGYQFLGWYDSRTHSQVYSTVSGGYGDKSFYALWKPIDYTITYVLNGGKNSSANPAQYNADSPKITYAVPTRNGYTFKGWFSDAKFTQRVYTIAPGSTGNRKIYAKWEPTKYSIKYVLNGGVNSSANPTLYTIESDKITYAVATKSGAIFAGWFTDPGYKTRAYTIAAGSTGERTIYAKWNYKLTYVLNGGTNSAGNPTVYNADNGNVTLKAATRSGYHFMGWYLDKACTVKAPAIAKGTIGAKTLYAKWRAKQAPKVSMTIIPRSGAYIVPVMITNKGSMTLTIGGSSKYSVALYAPYGNDIVFDGYMVNSSGYTTYSVTIGSGETKIVYFKFSEYVSLLTPNSYAIVGFAGSYDGGIYVMAVNAQGECEFEWYADK